MRGFESRSPARAALAESNSARQTRGAFPLIVKYYRAGSNPASGTKNKRTNKGKTYEKIIYFTANER